MSTTKKRIHIAVDDDLYESLDRLSKKENRTLSNTSLRLLVKAMELEEDFYFASGADKRLTKKERRVPHRKVWDED